MSFRQIQQSKFKKGATGAANRMKFAVADVADHLTERRTQSQGKPGWWNGVVRVEWENIRAGDHNTKWISVNYTDRAGVSGGLDLLVLGEKNFGRIAPKDQPGLAKLQQENPKMSFEYLKPRETKKPQLQIRKWDANVATVDKDSIEIVVDAQGKPLLPADETKSPYYAVAELINEIFESETEERLTRGQDLIAAVRAAIKKDPNAAAKDIVTEFNAASGGHRHNDTILSADQYNGLNKLFEKKPGEVDIIAAGCIITGNTKFCPVVQTRFGASNKKWAGRPIPNPLTRVSIGFDKNTGAALISISDKRLARIENGKTHYDVAKCNAGLPLVDRTVHEFFNNGTIIDGIISMNAICLSSMGISLPISAKLLVAEPAVYAAGTSQDELYDESYFGGASDESRINGGAGRAAAGTAADTAAGTGADMFAGLPPPVIAQQPDGGLATATAATPAAPVTVTTDALPPALTDDQMTSMLSGLGV